MDDKMILGNGVAYSMDSRQTGLNNNVLVNGGSGIGKTMSILTPLMLSILTAKRRSMVVSLTKRSLMDKLLPFAKEQGYHAGILNFVNPGESRWGYDPLRHVHSFQDIRYLASSFVLGTSAESGSKTDERYWTEAATSLLSALIALVLMTRQNPTFNDVLNLVDTLAFHESGNLIKTSLDQEFERLKAKTPTCDALSCWTSFRCLPPKTAGCVLGMMKTSIQTVFTPELRKMIALEDQIDFEQIADEKTILFIFTSAVNPALHCFANIFFTQMFKEMFEYAEKQPNGKLPVPVHFACDDFATGSRIQNFPDYISIMREKEMSVTLLIQSESQLESMYGHDHATTIINNCNTYVYMGGMDLKSAESVSKRLNAPLEDVLYMPIGQVSVFRVGQRPIIATRYDILNDPQYQMIEAEYEKQLRERMEGRER